MNSPYRSRTIRTTTEAPWRRAQALQVVQAYVTAFTDGRGVILHKQTIEKPYGWIFFYQDRDYLRSRDPSIALRNNGPLIFNRHTGEYHVTGTPLPLDAYVAAYENTLPIEHLGAARDAPGESVMRVESGTHICPRCGGALAKAFLPRTDGEPDRELVLECQACEANWPYDAVPEPGTGQQAHVVRSPNDSSRQQVVCSWCGRKFAFGRSACPICDSRYVYGAGRPILKSHPDE